MEYPQGSKR